MSGIGESLNPQDQEQNYRRAMMGRMLMNQQQPQGSSPWASLARAAGQMGGAYMMHPYLQAMQRLTGGQDQRGGQSPPQMGAPPLGTPGNGVPGNNQSTLTPGQGGVGQLTPPQMPLGGMGGQSPQGYPQAVPGPLGAGPQFQAPPMGSVQPGGVGPLTPPSNGMPRPNMPNIFGFGGPVGG